MKNTNEIPRWNIDTIFSGFDSVEYKNALKQLDFFSAQLKIIFSSAKNVGFTESTFSACLAEVIPFQNKFCTIYETLAAFAYAVYSTDTTNSEYLNNLAFIEEKSLVVEEVNLLWREFLSNNVAFLPSFFKNFPQYSDYKFVIAEEIIAKKYEMSQSEENLAHDLQRYGGDAWSKLQETLISNLVDDETGKTFNALRNEAYSEDAATRKTAYQKELALLKQNEIAFAACLNNLKGATVSLNKRRGWQSAIDRACFSSRISGATLNALIGAIEQSLPMWRDYLKTKASIMGKTALPFYDLFAPLPNNTDAQSSEKIWTFGEARDYIIEKYSSFSADMGEFAKMAFAENWIDAEVRKGKVGGAYCQDFPLQKVSRVLSNFTGTFSDVITLAHELGHAYHHWCIKDLDYALTKYPMTLAETASIFAETIVMKDILSHTTGYEHAKLIEMHLQDSCQVLVDILSRFYFEKSVFQERNTSELSSEDFCRLMTDAQNKSYGDGLSDEKHPYIWAVKSHYYSPDLDFYNFPYAFGLLFGLGLYRRYKTEGASFAQTYIEILRNTGKMSCEEVCKSAGFDITQKDFWLDGISTFNDELQELKKYASSNR